MVEYKGEADMTGKQWQSLSPRDKYDLSSIVRWYGVIKLNNINELSLVSTASLLQAIEAFERYYAAYYSATGVEYVLMRELREKLT